MNSDMGGQPVVVMWIIVLPSVHPSDQLSPGELSAMMEMFYIRADQHGTRSSHRAAEHRKCGRMTKEPNS